MSDEPHVALSQAADYVSTAHDEIEAGGLDVEGEPQFVEILGDLENTLRQLALLAEAATIETEEDDQT